MDSGAAAHILSGSGHTNDGDNMKNAIWADGTKLPEFPPLDGDRKVDVLIIGGGMAGILCAYQLKKARIDYALIEADRICHGVTRNTTAKITSQHGLIYSKLLREFDVKTARAYYDANQAALLEYAALTKYVDCGFERKDDYVYAVSPTEALEKEMEALKRLQIPAELTSDTLLPFPVYGAIRFRNQAQFDPLRFVSGICGELNLHEHTKAEEFVGNTVLTNRGRITAGKIIMATHFPILNKHGGYFLKLYQDRSYVMALENAGDVDGMYLGAEETGLSFRNYESLLLIGGGGHRTGKKGGGWEELEKTVQKYYPKAKEVCRWATQDCMTLDGMPYIGRYSRRTPDLYVATGFNKWGMTTSMVSAMILSDLVQGKENPYTEVFSPQRSVLRPQLAVNAVEAVWNLLTPTRPRCPHMGCALKWNRQEHSWDCPCHGSRFTEEGVLLDNPATGDLKTEKE